MRGLIHCLLALAPLAAQAPAPKVDPLAPLRFLAGTWKGVGGGQPGAAQGEATFHFELQGRALVRRSFADLPAAQGRLAGRHEDLTTIWSEGGQVRALYLDNEDHAIRYLVETSPEGAVFTSEVGPGPRFRLVYRRQGEGHLAFRFEIAPPQAPEAFKVYLQAELRRAE